ncbi:MAG: carbohydrate ABC transporter permease [bacterium]
MGKLLNITLNLKQKKSLKGYCYVAPFIIGFLVFFAYPFYQAIIFSLNNLRITQSGYVLEYVGLENFQTALLTNPNFTETLFQTTIQMVSQIPAIILFSFFVAVLLNQKFRGRLFARITFFLPLILSSGIIYQMESEDEMYTAYVQDADFMLGGDFLEVLLAELFLPEYFIEYIQGIVIVVPDIINASAIPILIFLAGLQSIPRELYEVAEVEGSTGWEKFWYITFPLLSPLFLTNIIFIIVDSLTSLRNPMVTYMQDYAWSGGTYGESVAMSMVYFVVVIGILLITVGVVLRYVFYME